jgi:hypothetical protein
MESKNTVYSFPLHTLISNGKTVKYISNAPEGAAIYTIPSTRSNFQQELNSPDGAAISILLFPNL